VRGAPPVNTGPGPVTKPSRETEMSAMMRIMPGQTRSAAKTHRSGMKRVAEANSIARRILEQPLTYPGWLLVVLLEELRYQPPLHVEVLELNR
jgi:hypothetical protein